MLEKQFKLESRLPFSLTRDGEHYHAQILVDPFNQRVKLTSFAGNLHEAAQSMLRVARKYRAGKAIAYVTRSGVNALTGQKFRKEGKIPGFFTGKDAFCMVAYLQQARAIPRDRKRADEIVQVALSKKIKSYDYTSFEFREAALDDHGVLADLYRSVFRGSYPTPVSDRHYLKRQMEANTVFQQVWDGETLCGAASLEIDPVGKSAEVTDCAVLPDYRGKGLLPALIAQLEHSAKARGIHCLYSLSRSLLPGINLVLSASGYSYHGRLINNCFICGGFEDMNVWQKFITV